MFKLYQEGIKDTISKSVNCSSKECKNVSLHSGTPDACLHHEQNLSLSRSLLS